MPFNLLLFPLVGGYYILANSEWFKYRTQRLQSERLLFNSIIAGCILLSVSFVLRWIALMFFNSSVVELKQIMPIKERYFGVTVVSFVLGIAFTEICNLLLNEVLQVKKAIASMGNELEKLLLFSADQRQLVQITLKNEKVYIGICSNIPVPDKTTYFSIIPFFSGFRDSNTKLLSLTTDYTEIYNDYVSRGKIVSVAELNTHIIINTNEILTANRFDFDLYDLFGGISANN